MCSVALISEMNQAVFTAAHTCCSLRERRRYRENRPGLIDNYLMLIGRPECAPFDVPNSPTFARRHLRFRMDVN